MKKSLIYIFAVLAAVMFTSCSDNDEPVNKQSFTSTINTRAIEGDAVYFSQNSRTFHNTGTLNRRCSFLLIFGSI